LAEEFDRARRLNRLPRAVVVVDLYGQCADYDAIVGLCLDHGVAVVEDAAEALGATYKGRPAGTLGHVGVFSFNGNKIITTSGGGMLVSLDPAIIDRVRYLSTQARQPVAHYEHHEVGFNYRMSNLLAAMGRVQLQRLPGFIERRLEINTRYRSLLGDLPDVGFWLTCVLFDSHATAVRVREHLAHIGVESRPLWWPMHRQPVFARCRARLDGTSDDLAARGLCLPSGSALTSDQVGLVASTVRTALGEARRSKWLVIDGEAARGDERTA
jgi:dTDP-4-amino-4,6-dideoxygalactose transaminase